jgi:hypothetical protein
MNEVIQKHMNILNKIILEDKKENKYDWKEV